MNEIQDRLWSKWINGGNINSLEQEKITIGRIELRLNLGLVSGVYRLLSCPLELQCERIPAKKQFRSSIWFENRGKFLKTFAIVLNVDLENVA